MPTLGLISVSSNGINYIMESFRDKTSSEALAYHYCDFSNPFNFDPSNIVGSLVRQHVVQIDQVPAVVKDMYHKCSGQAPWLDMLFELLKLLVGQNSTTTYLIIDGLDENPSRQIFLDGIQQLCKASNNGESLSVMLSSWPEYDICQALSRTSSFSTEHQHVELDMEMHVRTELTKMPKLCAMLRGAQERLISDLVNRADGMFPWVQC